jgi:hypothetical protein
MFDRGMRNRLAADRASFMTSLRFNGGLPHCSEGEPDEEFWKNFGHPQQNTQTRIAFLCREPRLVGGKQRRIGDDEQTRADECHCRLSKK